MMQKTTLRRSNDGSKMVQIWSITTKNPDSERKYLATRSFVRSIARTAHSFVGSVLRALLAHSVAFIRWLAPLTHSLPNS